MFLMQISKIKRKVYLLKENFNVAKFKYELKVSHDVKKEQCISLKKTAQFSPEELLGFYRCVPLAALASNCFYDKIQCICCALLPNNANRSGDVAYS